MALAQGLAAVERELQQAVAGRDGSPEARTRYMRARVAYVQMETIALRMLCPAQGRRDASMQADGLRPRRR
ncbi:hypothetical protein LXT21_44205 [Myxococcus sp. K38C18041901]|uniref:hypothetical protein n=1 Tax=Myxococcus guangdongensis TaxID=2906760 RepID=UPI0020A78C86|nr:hypothetical protein [Myxococcus guangdongensis]MCP3065793.1 hypothetical protein [Myxococcus guangdongensis]